MDKNEGMSFIVGLYLAQLLNLYSLKDFKQLTKIQILFQDEMHGNEKKFYEELPTYPPKKRYFSDLMDRKFTFDQKNNINIMNL